MIYLEKLSTRFFLAILFLLVSLLGKLGRKAFFLLQFLSTVWV